MLAMACLGGGMLIGSPALGADAASAASGNAPATPATQPAPADTPGNGAPMPGGRLGARPDGEIGPLRELLRERLGARPGQEMDEQTWNQVVQFLEKNAPNRFKYFQSLPETYKKQLIRTALLNRYLMVQWMKDQPQDQMLYNLIIHRVQIDDQCWALAQQYRAATNPQEQDTLKKKITDLLTDWAGNQLEERRIRIDRLKQILNEESARLEKDQSNIDQFVSKNVDRVINDENFLLMAAPPRGMEGPLGPPPGVMGPPRMDGLPPGLPGYGSSVDDQDEQQPRQGQSTDPGNDTHGDKADPAAQPGNP